MKLSQNEAMALASVFLRIKPTLKFEKRKTTHRTHQAYKNITIGPNDRGGLLVTAGIVPGVRLEKGNYPTLSAFFAQMATD